MTQAENFSSVLTDFALTMATNLPVQAMVDDLVARICDILPVDGAGVTLRYVDNPAHMLAASSADARHLEEAQIDLGDGPSVAAFALETPAFIVDTSENSLFPRLARPMRMANTKSIFSFPMRYGNHCLGSLSLYTVERAMLSAAEQVTAQTLADVTAAFLFNARTKIQVALDSRRHESDASHDALTGLPNRAFLALHSHDAPDPTRDLNDRMAALFLDIDHFKIVNDSYGHAVGDELLVLIAQRVTGVLRLGDTLARVSGDEFVIICKNVRLNEDVVRLASRIRKAFSLPFVLKNHVLAVSVSIGIAVSVPGAAADQALVDDADKAMYRAKRLGGGMYQVFDEHMDDDERARIHLTVDLTAALGSDQIVLAYQPIISNDDSRMTGVEALLRWTHPVLGYVDAFSAITLAEESGLIIEIGFWVLETACHAQATWAAAKPDHPMTVSINVSAKQLMEPDFADRTAAIMTAQGTRPDSIILEVTESAVFDGGPVPQENLFRLQQLGVRVSLDDFGTGYSTLTHLRTFTANNVKIEQHFISDMASDRVAAVIVSSITSLAKSLGVSVTAEGIETIDQHALVIEAGADFSQGYLFGRAMPADEILALL